MIRDRIHIGLARYGPSWCVKSGKPDFTAGAGFARVIDKRFRRVCPAAVPRPSLRGPRRAPRDASVSERRHCERSEAIQGSRGRFRGACPAAPGLLRLRLAMTARGWTSVADCGISTFDIGFSASGAPMHQPLSFSSLHPEEAIEVGLTRLRRSQMPMSSRLDMGGASRRTRRSRKARPLEPSWFETALRASSP